MKRIKLSGDEVKILHDCLNQGDPQRGMGLSEIRELMPLVDKLEAPAEKKNITTPQGQREMLNFKDMELVLKESEFTTCTQKMDGATGLMTVDYGRKIVELLDRMKEIASEPDPEEKTDKKD